MEPLLQSPSPTLRRFASPRVWLVQVALAIGAVLFAPLYLTIALAPWLPRTFYGPPPTWYYTLMVLNSGRNLLFSHLAIYLALTLLGITCALIALCWARPHPIIRVLLVMVVLAIVAFPWIYTYQPGLVTAPGRAMRLPTQPGFVEGVIKAVQAGAEITPCTYELLGWDATNILFYRSTCGNDPAVTWWFNPNHASSEPHVAQRIPDDLYREPSSSPAVLDRVRAPSVWPETQEPSTRRIHLREGAIFSREREWVALIARHVYGPEDVVIVQWGPE